MRTLGVAILGASTYDNHPDDNNPRFKRSAEVFREAITNPNIIGERKHKVLYLFDRRYSQETIVKQIAKFVAKGNFDDVIIYYCGHGVVPLNSKKYIVQLRTTDRSAINSSGLKIGDLMHDLDRALLAKRTLLVLDACYSGDALKELMDGTFAATAIAEHFKENLVRESRAALVSSGLKEASKALTEDECTLFTGTLVDILKRGIARLPAAPTFSLQDLNNEIDHAAIAARGQHR
jgi:hypothetical protein